MREGLLWFDNDPNRKVIDKIKLAASRYQTKLKSKPTVCYLNPAEFDEKQAEINGIQIKPVNNILPHHFMIGVEQT